MMEIGIILIAVALLILIRRDEHRLDAIEELLRDKEKNKAYEPYPV
jgi:hypothetical protein